MLVHRVKVRQSGTHKSLCSSTSSSSESHGERVLISVAVKQKVTVFLGARVSLTSRGSCGLASARCFHCIAHLLTTRRRRRNFCNANQGGGSESASIQQQTLDLSETLSSKQWKVTIAKVKGVIFAIETVEWILKKKQRPQAVKFEIAPSFTVPPELVTVLLWSAPTNLGFRGQS